MTDEELVKRLRASIMPSNNIKQLAAATIERLTRERDDERAVIAERDADVAAIRQGLSAVIRERDAAERKVEKLRAALKDATASLVAATSLLQRGGKKAAPSNKMFDQMVRDYMAASERARAALAETEKTDDN